METAQKLDTKGIIAGWTIAMTDMYCKDLRAMTYDQFVAPQAGKARAANLLTGDACAMAIHVTKLLGGNLEADFTFEEDMNACVAKMTSIEAAVNVVSETGGALSAAIGAADDDYLATVVTAPWGQPMPLFLLANIAASHIWYHDGQINLIQAMNGDGDVHWMDQ